MPSQRRQRSQRIQRRQRSQRIIRRQRSQRIIRRHIRLNAPINNGDTLRRIANLPQQITNDLLIVQFFNGFSFR